ncbi:MAG: Glutathione S-transferase YfcF [Myxococcota bacterium]|nr:Glutathione S-transferase YfcF [Myxococcota bacterium]
MPDQLTLYGEKFWYSPYVFSAWVALKEKGVPFEVQTLSLGDRENATGFFQKHGVTARVPMLNHNGFWLSESSAISEYLEEVFPPPAHPRLFPADMQERARARHVMSWLRSDLLALREERPTTTMFFERAKAPLTDKARAAADKLRRVAGQLVGEGQTQLFANWSMADADLTFMLHRLILNGDEVPDHVRHYAEFNWKRPSIQEWVNTPRPPYVPYSY